MEKVLKVNVYLNDLKDYDGDERGVPRPLRRRSRACAPPSPPRAASRATRSSRSTASPRCSAATPASSRLVLTIMARGWSASRWVRTAAAAVGLCLSWCGVVTARGDLERYDAGRLSMGCVYTIAAYSADRGSLPRILEAALDEVDRIDRLMSHYRPDSPLSRLNREAAQGAGRGGRRAVRLHRRVRCGTAASPAARSTSRSGPLMKAWGFFRGDGRVPERRGELDAVRGAGRLPARHPRRRRQDDPLRPAGRGARSRRDRQGLRRRSRRRPAPAATASRPRWSAPGGSTVYGLGAPPGRTPGTSSVQDPSSPARSPSPCAERPRAVGVRAAPRSSSRAAA